MKKSRYQYKNRKTVAQKPKIILPTISGNLKVTVKGFMDKVIEQPKSRGRTELLLLLATINPIIDFIEKRKSQGK